MARKMRSTGTPDRPDVLLATTLSSKSSAAPKRRWSIDGIVLSNPS
jgi:hypothetical protein